MKQTPSHNHPDTSLTTPFAPGRPTRGSWLYRISVLLTLFSAIPAFGQSRYVIVSDRLAEVEQAAQTRGGVVQNRLKYIKGIVVDLPDQGAASLRARFGKDAIIEPDLEYSTSLQPSTPRTSKGKPGGGGGGGTPSQTIPWGINTVLAPLAWPNFQGSGVIVGVVDTGIQPDHPDLPPNTFGENFVAKRGAVDSSKWADDSGHGTHVAGTIAALDNSIGVVGVSPQARLFAAKVLDSRGTGPYSAVADGIAACVASGAQVINMSISGGYSEVVELAVQYAHSQGVIMVAAAGNLGAQTTTYPAQYPEVIAVSAIDSDLQIASFSGTSHLIEYTAPGVDILSTYRGSGYSTMSGTSMATPHVSGIVALMLSAGIDILYAVDIGLTVEQQGNGLISALPPVIP